MKWIKNILNHFKSKKHSQEELDEQENLKFKDLSREELEDLLKKEAEDDTESHRPPRGPRGAMCYCPQW